MKTFLGLVPLVVVLLLTNGCVSPVATEKSPVTNPPQKSGTVSLKISVISEELKRAQAAGNRALLYADGVWLSVTNANNETLFESAVYFDETDLSSTTRTFGPIPVGTDLTVSVNVYNKANPEWTLFGSVSGVSILEGQTTETTIVCLPSWPVAMSKNTAYSASLAARGEAWYSFGSGSNASLTLTQATTSGVSTLLFDANGEYVATISGGVDFQFEPLPDSTYYVGVAAGDSAVTSALTLTGQVFNEGSSAAPLPLVAGNVHTFSIGNATGETTSYYQFSTTVAGDYLIHPLEGQADIYVNLYKDGSSVVGSYGYLNNGFFFPNLAASTVYEIRLTNQTGSLVSFSGQVLDPTGVAAIANSEGTALSPIPLTVGTPRAAVVGFNSWDKASYYSFTTGTPSEVDFQVADAGNSAYFQATLSTSAVFAADQTQVFYLYPGSLALAKYLASNTTYYLKLSNGSSSSSVRNFTLSVFQPTYIEASVADAWVSGTLTVAEPQQRYLIPVSPGTYLGFSLHDYWTNPGTLTGKVKAYVRSENGTNLTPTKYSSTGVYLVTVPEGCTKLLVTILPDYSITTDFTYQWKLVQVATGGLTVVVR